MAENKREFGIVGLGQIGGNLARQAIAKGLRVVGFTKGDAPSDLVRAGLVELRSLAGFRSELSPPRVILFYVPAGPVVDELLEAVSPHLEKDDIVADGGNSYWGDSIRRHAKMRERGFHFIDLGTSGGIPGARDGACFMAGGDPEAIEHAEAVLKTLAVEGGYVFAGPPGAGHFVKLVHNGIEFGMLQAISEGVDLLEHYHAKLNIADILNCWRHGSVIRSWLIDLMEQTYRSEGGSDKIPPYVEDTGEVNWLVDDAMHMEVPVPVIAQSVMQLFASRDDGQRWARAVAMMRHGFGGHPYGPDRSIAHKRGQSRVGGFVREPSAANEQSRKGE